VGAIEGCSSGSGSGRSGIGEPGELGAGAGEVGQDPDPAYEPYLAGFGRDLVAALPAVPRVLVGPRVRLGRLPALPVFACHLAAPTGIQGKRWVTVQWRGWPGVGSAQR